MAKLPTRRSSKGEIDAFLKKSRDITEFQQRQPRLLFAIDATASRQPTWDTACQQQQAMFLAASSTTSLRVQLCYYRGFNEFYASPWLDSSEQLASTMGRVYCEGGHTQIASFRFGFPALDKTPLPYSCIRNETTTTER